ncbi:MAG: 30S ribosomal protein S5 [Candidatus Micrarchaeia archaeon]|jgi:small subunit ribosomal protein S5
MRMQTRRREHREERVIDLSGWTPKTALGRKVKSGEITSIDQILDKGQKILEPEIVTMLLPDLKEEVLALRSTQRMTASGRKQKMEAFVALGNKRGYIALGIGKAVEARDAIAEAIADAKKRVIKVRLGCGSWECGCGTGHSVPREVTGKNSSTRITIRPAPRGVGLVAGEVAKKVLTLAGVSDAWTFAKGRTRNVLNMVLATIDALDSLNALKAGKGASIYEDIAAEVAKIPDGEVVAPEQTAATQAV